MILNHIHSPADLRKLAPGELPLLCAELRQNIIDTVSSNGGHLAASLGAVELIVALHYLFNTPDDKILFDVGHQAYAHKLLTGRKEAFDRLRQVKGCAGFPTPAESEFDPCITGHAGVAISNAVGIAAANWLRGERGKVVAVVGDGSLNCGISLEGLNNAKAHGKNLIVILNDNKMSISPNVGGLPNYLNRLISGGPYNRFKRTVKDVIKTLPRHDRIHRIVRKIAEAVKGFLLPGVVFEELGFRYIGPIDGNDLEKLLHTIGNIKDLQGPFLIHVITRKGLGYKFAEADPENYHGVSGFCVEDGKLTPNGSNTFSKAFGKSMIDLASAHPEVVAITAAMACGTGLKNFADKLPRQFFDVGIAEEHAVSFAAGLATNGIRPVVAIYSTFIQRALDNIYHDVVLAGLPVIFALDRAGAVEDGPTHHGIYDLGFLLAMPGLTVMAPADEAELELMLNFAYELKKPVAIRYPRGGSRREIAATPLKLGKADIVKDGNDAMIWATNLEVATALEVADLLANDNIDAGVVNTRFLSPFDRETLLEHKDRAIVTIEDHTLTGGLAAVVDSALAAAQTHGKILHFGWPNELIGHGKISEIRQHHGMDAAAIAAKIKEALS